MHQRKHEAYMSNDVKIAVLENTIGHINETLSRIDQKIDRLNQRMDKLDHRQWTNFLWLLSAIIGLAGVMAHGFHWL